MGVAAPGTCASRTPCREEEEEEEEGQEGGRSWSALVPMGHSSPHPLHCLTSPFLPHCLTPQSTPSHASLPHLYWLRAQRVRSASSGYCCWKASSQASRHSWGRCTRQNIRSVRHCLSGGLLCRYKQTAGTHLGD